LLRRPISVCDVERNRVRLVFPRGRGVGPRSSSRARVGDELDVMGPLGRPALELRGEEVLFCGGGIGAAPLLFLPGG